MRTDFPTDDNNNSLIIDVYLSPRVYRRLAFSWVAPESGTPRSQPQTLVLPFAIEDVDMYTEPSNTKNFPSQFWVNNVWIIPDLTTVA